MKVSRIILIHMLCLDYVRLSTTVATNALLERKGERHALLITSVPRVAALRGLKR
jgi:5-oxoprolinase (ATP-hydrolysing)